MAVVVHLDECDLLSQLQEGDHSAFVTLYNRYAKGLYWKIKQLVKHDEQADELLQDLFVKVWERRANINITQSFKAYLYKSAQHMAVDYFRQLERQNRLQDEFSKVNSFSAETTEEELLARETQQLIDEAIAQLSVQRRTAFILCKVEGKSYVEAAEIMQISPNTVHNHLVKAVQLVKERLANSDKELSLVALFIALC